MKNIYFSIGTGRCGTKFISELLALEPLVASSHERQPLSDTFHRYCKWYNLPVDDLGFIQTKRKDIDEDLKNSLISFESSAYLSLSVNQLNEHFNAKFILMVRSPEKVVASYVRKGWYENNFLLNDENKIPSFQQNVHFHHFLGRTLPKGDDVNKWKNYSQVGKLAWYWNILNKEIIKQFDHLPTEKFKIVRLEDFNYTFYINEICPFLDIKSAISKEQFDFLSGQKPNSFSNIIPPSQWSNIEKNEFKNEVSEMCSYFGYEGLDLI